jgi:hypothetical protein
LPLLKIFTLLSVLLCASACCADERIWLRDAQLNGRPARLFFDTGANDSAVCFEAAKRLGINVDPVLTNGASPETVVDARSSGILTFGGNESTIEFAILNFPNYSPPDFDGMIGWPSIHHNVLQLDASKRNLEFLPGLPKQVASWARFPINTNSGMLDLEVANCASGNGMIFIDTGCDWGLGLPHQAWRQWKDSHPHSPRTFKTYYTLNDGFMVLEESWADRISVGPLVLTNVPIIEEPPSFEMIGGENHECTFGLAALSRVDVIVDGTNCVAYLHPKSNRAADYPHNRLGAVFVPTSQQPEEGVARVEVGSPAYDAGVRNGDILLQVDEIPVVSWSGTWLSRFSMPSGTKLHLTLQRDGKKFQTTAILRQIIPPADNRDN